MEQNPNFDTQSSISMGRIWRDLALDPSGRSLIYLYISVLSMYKEVIKYCRKLSSFAWYLIGAFY